MSSSSSAAVAASAITTTTKVTHEVESRADRRQQRELAAARQSGSVAPAIDAATGQMINPHNPEFITKRPWYLGNDGNGAAASAAESLSHQADQRPDSEKKEFTLQQADALLQKQREQQRKLQLANSKSGTFVKGQWAEALKKNKPPYRICQITKVHKKTKEYDLQFEDGTVEHRVSVGHKRSPRPRIRSTNTGNRSQVLDATTVKETYSSKRDKYHGYDPTRHNAILTKKYEQKLELRREQREKEANRTTQKGGGGDNGDTNPNKAGSDSDFDDSDVEDGNNDGDESDDEFVQKDADDVVMTTRLARQGGVGGAQMKVTARNLRIREDTAKYLRNLDPNSAYYDPKSRSMRDNPHPERAPTEVDFAGDNFARISGDAVTLAQQQLFAWDATDRGVQQVHPQANPSQAEVLKRTFQTKADTLQRQRQRNVLQKYGGEEYLDGGDGLASTLKDSKTAAEVAQDRKLRFGVSTETKQYSADGRLKDGSGGNSNKPRQALVSKYEENIYNNGHSTVWGSYFHKGGMHWGYADDHSLMKQSYCTGENGRRANDEANAMTYGTGVAGSAALAQARKMLRPKPAAAPAKAPPVGPLQSKLYGEADQNVELNQKKVQQALDKMDKGDGDKDDKKKRKYHSLNADVDVTPEVMEAYRLRKEQKSDPMANIGSDEVLDYSKG